MRRGSSSTRAITFVFFAFCTGTTTSYYPSPSGQRTTAARLLLHMPSPGHQPAPPPTTHQPATPRSDSSPRPDWLDIVHGLCSGASAMALRQLLDGRREQNLPGHLVDF